MTEIQSILQSCLDAEGKGQPLALATVVKVEGSVYRRPGARMLILADGNRIGAISGGCLEADVIQRAQRVMASGEPEYVLYDTRVSNGDLIFELGCKGAVGILIERVTPPSSPALQGAQPPRATVSSARQCVDFLASFRRDRGVGALATVFRTEGDVVLRPGDRFFLRRGKEPGSDAVLSTSLMDPKQGHTQTQCIQDDMSRCLESGHAMTQRYTLAAGAAEVLIEPVRSPILLLLCGAGQDAPPVARMAALLGWDVTVADHRASLLTPDRFPAATICQVEHLERLPAVGMLDERTATVVMTHSYAHDRAWLEHILPSAAGYVGLLGPRRRAEEMQAQLCLAELRPAERRKALARLHSPIGLDIGSETAEEIALAIVAEIQAFFHNASGGFLQNRRGPIHAPHQQSSSLPEPSIAVIECPRSV